jgi:hypothetical protein
VQVLKRPVVDRLVVSDSVAQQVEPRNLAVYVATATLPWKCPVNTCTPERSFVPARQEISPEAQRKFSHNAARGLGTPVAGRVPSRIGYNLACFGA